MTPQEVSSKTFPKAVMGGYGMAAVDEFLDKLTEDYTELFKENTALKGRIKQLNEKIDEYRQIEESMRATLLAALWTSKLRHRALAPLPPVICNMVLVGAELALFYPAEGMGFWAAFGLNALTVGIGEAAACFILGSLLLQVLPRVPALKSRMAPSRV